MPRVTSDIPFTKEQINFSIWYMALMVTIGDNAIFRVLNKQQDTYTHINEQFQERYKLVNERQKFIYSLVLEVLP
jgi:hypothetical protein